MTDKPRVILDAKAWQEGLMATEGDCHCATMPISSPIRRHGSNSMNPNSLVIDDGLGSKLPVRALAAVRPIYLK